MALLRPSLPLGGVPDLDLDRDLCLDLDLSLRLDLDLDPPDLDDLELDLDLDLGLLLSGLALLVFSALDLGRGLDFFFTSVLSLGSDLLRDFSRRGSEMDDLDLASLEA